MKTLTLRVPIMYADHHVLQVRNALNGLDGVAETAASSARRQVTVSYEEDAISPQAIESALAEAGYPPGQEPSLPEVPKNHEDGSSWFTILQRVTTTEMKDLEMSGDFRKY